MTGDKIVKQNYAYQSILFERVYNVPELLSYKDEKFQLLSPITILLFPSCRHESVELSNISDPSTRKGNKPSRLDLAEGWTRA